MDIPFVDEIPIEMLPASCNLLGMGLYKGLTIWYDMESLKEMGLSANSVIIQIPMVHHHVPH